MSTAPDEMVAALEVESEITNVVVASPPVINFTVTTADGVPITGIREIWLDDSSYVRFTFCKLVPGTNGDPDVWVSYTRDATTNAPDYDTGSDLVDNGDGTYVFTYNTDVATVPGVPYEPTLTHRAAGQIGSRSEPLEAQNLWFDFVPAGGALPDTRYIAVVDSCNECHDELIFHGRRYLVEYCVTCHNPDLSSGEGNFPFMIHRLHSGGMFDVLRGGRDFSHVTYPQNLRNCRKCHNGADAATPQGDNWKMLPNIVACDGCHNNFSTGTHTGGMQTDNTGCAGCHPPSAIEDFHTTPDLTPNNPMILPNQRSIVYEMLEASVGGGNVLTINFQITSDGG
ncbi:MAG: OmcA/MtrC family decaheme c-type cytochrome [Planctomycetota bacterium]